MRIAVLTTSFPRSPDDEAGIFIRHMIEAQSKLGSRGFILVPKDSAEPSEENCGGFQIRRYRYGVFAKGALAFGAGIIPNLKARPILLFQIPGLLFGMLLTLFKLRHEVEVIHANWIPSGLVAVVAKLILRKPYVITIRGEDYRLLVNPLFRLVSKLLLYQASAITSVNQSFLKQLGLKFEKVKDKLFFVPNGVNQPNISPDLLKDFVQKNKLNHNTPYLIFIGTVIPRKRLEILVDLLKLLPDYNLIICGRCNDNAYFEKIQTQIKLENLQDRIQFVGPVIPSEIPYYLKLSRAYVSASEFEGRSNSILEALAAGIPVIASDIEGHREVVQDNVNGYLFDVNQLQPIALKIQELMKDPVSQQRIKSNAIKSVETFSWESCASNYLKVFESTVK